MTMDMNERERLDRQCDDLNAYLDEHEWITHREAEDELGIMRLSARIFDLKAQGHVFEWKWVPFKARNGRTSRIKAYKKVA